MQQYQDIVFNHQSLLQIQHVKTGRYLKGTIHPYKTGVFKKQTIDEFYIGTTGDDKDYYTYFIIEKINPTNSELRYGDMISIKNYANQLYINYDKKRNSEITKQGYIYLKDSQDVFILQPQNQTVFNIQQIIVNQNPLRIVSPKTSSNLHSHAINYNNKEVNQYNEVTAYDQCDENDYWILKNIQEGVKLNYIYQPIQNQTCFIINMDKVIIRNFWTGWTLHSHNSKYKSTNQQEITAYNYPRDENDYWTFTKTNVNNNEIFYIQSGEAIFLQHIKTKNLLHYSQNDTYTSSGKQPICNQVQNPYQFLIIETTNNSALKLNQPFTISYNKQYLTQTEYRNENKVGIQQEVAFQQFINAKSYWIIEQREK